MARKDIICEDEKAVTDEIAGHRDSRYRLIISHPYVRLIKEKGIEVDHIRDLNPNERRALATINWLDAEIKRLEAILYQFETGKLAAQHRAECLREIA
ncbi:hypothetical protein ACFSB1_11260 [Halopseudomonas phragmitis]|uniref:Uncharacterized protein n=1 Tax=Halopseudomonas phragmitis TaxID=1931241 RepID=A0A1V0B041_9GAMM|nr:hypothetical protein [Halopseudomonas phragmitis]AQZ93251.1 hypothetical protein BVH74_00020 [Halopseudomonas phragmitis]